MQFSFRELFFLPTEHNMKFMYTKFRRKKRNCHRRRIQKKSFACSAALPPAVMQWTLSRSPYARGVKFYWHRKNDNYCFWDSLSFTISRFRLVAVNLSILFHLFEVAFFFFGGEAADACCARDFYSSKYVWWQ